MPLLTKEVMARFVRPLCLSTAGVASVQLLFSPTSGFLPLQVVVRRLRYGMNRSRNPEELLSDIQADLDEADEHSSRHRLFL